MTDGNPIFDLLAAPVENRAGGVVWYVDTILDRMVNGELPAEIRFEANTDMDRQVLSLIRPVLAAFAVRHAQENGGLEEVFSGPLRFDRLGKSGPMTISGSFMNRQSELWIALTCQASSFSVAAIRSPNSVSGHRPEPVGV